MKIKSIVKEKIFIPEFRKNKELPEKEQVKIEIKSFPSVIQAAEYKKYSMGTDLVAIVSYKYDLIFARHVGKITNLEDGKGIIKDGIMLADSTELKLGPLITEIRDYLISYNEDFEPGES